MCAPRQPLSPLYDEPCSPEINCLDEASALVSGSPVSLDLNSKTEFILSRFASANQRHLVFYHLLIPVLISVVPWRVPQHHPHQQDQQLLPPSFQLCTPPLGKRNRRSLVLTNSRGDVLGPETESRQGQAEQRAEAVWRLKLLPVPGGLQEQVCDTPQYSQYVCYSCSQQAKLTSVFTSADGSAFQLCEEYIVHTLQLLPRYEHKECNHKPDERFRCLERVCWLRQKHI